MFVPFFFVVSGMQLDVDAMFSSVSGVLKIVSSSRSSSSCAARRRCCSTAACSTRASASALALFTATQLPLVLAITTLAQDSGHMRSSTAASLVGAAVLSTLVYPILGLRVRGTAPPPVPPAEAERVLA